jgi:periplasmic copper chaperone A
MHKLIWFILPAALATGLAASAGTAEIAVTNAWFRALPGGLPAGGYFSLHNGGSANLELVGAKSSACGMLMLHESTENGGVSRMMQPRSVTVPAGGAVDFAPGGYHLMCMDPGAAMVPGKKLIVTLVFAGGTRIDTSFVVKNAAGK